MQIRALLASAMTAVSLVSLTAQAEEAASTEAVYQQHCASCHGGDRLGGMGPALLPENLSRLRKDEAHKVIREGRPATQMPAFGDTLSDKEVNALAEFIYQSPETAPTWKRADIKQSHRVPHPLGSLPDEPVFEADLMNLFLVVQLAIIMSPCWMATGWSRSTVSQPLRPHGGPKYSPDGRYVYRLLDAGSSSTTSTT